MAATAGTTTIEIPIPLRERLVQYRRYPRQPYHEVIREALDLLETRQHTPGMDPLIERHRNALRRAAREHRIGRLWLFGSRARGDAGPGADIDLLCQTLPGATLFDLSGFLADAKEILGVDVDVADIDGLKPAYRKRILPEAVVV